MNSIKLLEQLKEKAVFNISDIERITSSNGKYAKVILSRLKKRNLIKHLSKNLYTTNENIYLISSNLVYPSYISFWSASAFLGYTEQILKNIQIATTRKIKEINFEGYCIKFIKIKEFFGFKKINTEKGDIFVAEDEKLIIDSLLRYKELGNFDEIKKVFESSKIKKEKIIDYLKRINNQTLLKRVGYLLDKIKKIDLSDEFKLDKNYILLNPFSKKWKKINSKWRIKE